MAINHTDKCWWKTFCQEAKRAYRRKDIETMAHLYELYEQHMHQRLMREYHYYKRLDYEALRRKGAIDRRLDYYEWLKDNPY